MRIFQTAFLLIATLFFSNSATTQEMANINDGFFINSQPEGATIHIEGEVIGKTPCWFPYNITGKYRLKAEKSGYEKWSKIIDFGNEIQDSIALTLAPKKHARAFSRSLLIPGWGQNYSEQKVKSKVFLTLQLTSLLSLGVTHLYYENCIDEYDTQVNEYNLARKSFTLESKAWKDVTSAHSRLENAFKYRKIALYTTIGIYALNVLDALFFFPKNLRGIDIYGQPISHSAISIDGYSVVLSYNF